MGDLLRGEGIGLKFDKEDIGTFSVLKVQVNDYCLLSLGNYAWHVLLILMQLYHPGNLFTLHSTLAPAPLPSVDA